MRGLYKLPASYDTHTRERAERSILQITLWGVGGLFSSPQESMEIQNYSVLKRVKKLKLAKNRKPSDIFKFIPRDSFKAKELPTREFLPKQEIKKEKPVFNKPEYEAIFQEIREKWPKEVAMKLGKKRRRKLHKDFPSELHWTIFNRWCRICRRNRANSIRNRRKKPKVRKSKYQEFIESPQWQSRKNRYYQNNARECAACGSKKHIHLHHMVYSEYGNEPDEHLMPLCKTHHDGFHGKNGTQRHMIRATMAYIEEVRGAVHIPLPSSESVG